MLPAPDVSRHLSLALVLQAHAAALRTTLDASNDHLTALHDAIVADGEDAQALPEAPVGEDAPDALASNHAAVQGLLESRGVVGAKLEALQERCAQLGATNEELKCAARASVCLMCSHFVYARSGKTVQLQRLLHWAELCPVACEAGDNAFSTASPLNGAGHCLKPADCMAGSR